jgi:hypothetical protein
MIGRPCRSVSFSASPAKKDAEAAGKGTRPFLIVHLAPLGRQPQQIPDAAASYGAALEEIAAAKHRMLAPDAQHAPGEDQQIGLIGLQVPIHPRDVTVLAVGIVVAMLGAGKLVARQQHRHPLRQRHRGDEVAPLARAQGVDAGIVRGALGAAVPGQIVVVAVAVVFQIRLVVPLLAVIYVRSMK